jgi:hypothetical protein
LGVAKGKFTYETPEYQEVYTRTVYGIPYQADGTDDLTYTVGTEQQKVQVSLQLVNEGALNTLREGDDELTVVKDWDHCQVELGPGCEISPRAMERELWEPGTQVRTFYGAAEEKSSQSIWLHRRPKMWNVQGLPNTDEEEGLIRIVKEAIQAVEHVSISQDPKDNVVHFDPNAPAYNIGCDTQLAAGGHVAKQRPMLGVGITDETTHEETMELNKRAFKLAKEAAARFENPNSEGVSGCVPAQCSLPGYTI